MIRYKAVRLMGLPVLVVLCAAVAEVHAQTVREDFDVPNGQVTNAVVAGNTLYIAGWFTQVGPWTGGAAAFDLPSRILEPGFPKVEGNVYAVMADGQGGWYVGGFFASVGGQLRNGLAHIRADKSVSSWNPNVNGYVAALERRRNILYIGGSFTEVGGQPRSNIAAVDAVTGLVTRWNPGVISIGGQSSYVHALALRGTTLYLGGYFFNAGGAARNGLAALDTETGMATSWNPYFVNVLPVNALKVRGKSVLVGASPYYPTESGGLLGVDGVTGSTTWNPEVYGPVYAIALGNGRVYAGGDFGAVGGFNPWNYRRNLVEFDAATGLPTSWTPHPDGPVYALAARGYDLYVGGAFNTIGAQSREGLALVKPNTGTVDGWKPPRARDVSALAVSEEGVFAGGTFTSLGGQIRNGLAALDIPSGAVTGWNPDPSGIDYDSTGVDHFRHEIKAMATDGSSIYVGGQFTRIGGQPRNNVAALDATTGEATSWDPYLQREYWPYDEQRVTALAVHSGIVYLGGCFRGFGGSRPQSRHGLAAVDAATGLLTGWDPIANGAPEGELCDEGSLVTDGGTVYTRPLPGYFSGNRLRAFDAATGLQTPWNPDEDNWIGSIALGGGVMYAGGRFSHIGGQPRNGLAALDLNTGLATGWDPGLQNHPTWIYALLVDNGKVYVGAPSFIEALDETSAAPLWRVDVSGNAYAFAVSGNLLFAGGWFTEINGLRRSWLAAIQLPQ